MRTRSIHAMSTATALAALAVMTAAGAEQARDRGIAPAGTAAIAGVVLTGGDPGTPVRRAIVTATGGGLPSSPSVITDDAGRFKLTGLPAGRFTVAATKPAYLESAYGARRPGRAGTPLVLAEGQQVEIVIQLARGAVMEGTITDETGNPFPGVEVYALDARTPGSIGLRLTARNDVATTDDRGVYRIYGLAPAEYVIAVSQELVGDGEIGRRREAEVDALLDAARRRRTTPGPPPPPPPPAPVIGYPITFYPGVPVFAQATRVKLAAGDERAGLDFALVPAPVATVEGFVSRSDGLPPSTVELSLGVDGPMVFGGPGGGGSRPILSKAPGPDGAFTYTSMAPGRYSIYARASMDPPQPGAGPGRGGGVPVVRFPEPGSSSRRYLYAVADVDVTGVDISGLALTLLPGARITGRVEFDSVSAAPPDDLSKLQVRAATTRNTSRSSSGGTTMGAWIVAVPPVAVETEGTFDFPSVAPGRYRLSAMNTADVGEGWWLRSAMFNGADLLDVPLDVATADLTGVVLTLTDRKTELAGTLQSGAGLPAPEYFVVVLPADPSLWHAGSRRIKSTRPDTNGAFSVSELPGGTYLVAALTDLEPVDLEDSAFLEELAAQAVPVTVVDGERTVQDLRIAR